MVVVILHFKKKTKQTVHVDRLSPFRARVETYGIAETPEVATKQATPVSMATPASSGSEVEHQTYSKENISEIYVTGVTSKTRRIRRPPAALESYIW